jgi:hypothetical protein
LTIGLSGSIGTSLEVNDSISLTGVRGLYGNGISGIRTQYRYVHSDFS